MKSPIVTRKRLETEVGLLGEQLAKQQEEIRQLNNERIATLSHNQQLKEDLKVANYMAHEVIPKLAKMSISGPDPEYGKYRVCVDIDTRTVEMCFDHGGDDRYLRWAAETIGRAVYVKLTRFNFTRCGNVNHRRYYSPCNGKDPDTLVEP